MKKIIFLDIDGTLVDTNNYIPISTKRAILAARNNGHKTYICTGRSQSEVFDDILSLGFDGMIFSNGGHVIAGTETIFEAFFTKQMVANFAEFMDKHQIVFSIQNQSGLFASKKYIQRYQKISEGDLSLISDQEKRQYFLEHRKNILSALNEEEHLVQDRVTTVNFIGQSQADIDALFLRYGTEFECYQNVVPFFGSYSGEISLKGVTKGEAIKKVAAYEHIDISQTIGIGDGVNDLPMFEAVGTSVAMGNASSEVKENVDIITANIDDDGIEKIFSKLELM